MKVNNVFAGRPGWYDRNPLAINKVFSASAVAPHAFTSRWSYTVPVGRKAMIENVDVEQVRVTVWTTPGQLQALVFDSTTTMVYAETDSFANTVSDRDRDSKSAQSFIPANTIVSGATTDSGIGGTALLGVNMKATEFDA